MLAFIPRGIQGICPIGHFCPAGSSQPTACPDGQYQNQKGQSSCKPCPAGYYCRSSQVEPLPCPPGFYCSLGTSMPTACPDGTYGDNYNLTGPDQCTHCPAGHYCTNGTVTGICSAGYVCYFGNAVPNPNSNTTGGLCPRGYYCPPGTTVPVRCPMLRYSFNLGAAQEACPPWRAVLSTTSIAFSLDLVRACTYMASHAQITSGVRGRGEGNVSTREHSRQGVNLSRGLTRRPSP